MVAYNAGAEHAVCGEVGDDGERLLEVGHDDQASFRVLEDAQLATSAQDLVGDTHLANAGSDSSDDDSFEVFAVENLSEEGSEDGSEGVWDPMAVDFGPGGDTKGCRLQDGVGFATPEGLDAGVEDYGFLTEGESSWGGSEESVERLVSSFGAGPPEDGEDSIMEDSGDGFEVTISSRSSDAAGYPGFAKGQVIVSTDGLAETTGVIHLIRIEHDTLRRYPERCIWIHSTRTRTAIFIRFKEPKPFVQHQDLPMVGIGRGSRRGIG